ncbi:MAG: nicotinate (nicotinamide) nucleotide adenylyltransferase [Clostridiales Family XIII bacterium]|jgi:nicotinate-nucleotide adenylyltransferase|nr:nicotinate (nicotinamide) nucleotide adenylyltransferase [Clostridiales Family XIII bacterium]
MSGGVRVGVLGGSFDPVHTGHLILAEEALQALALTRVLFMPTYIQPFKQDAEVSPAAERLNMLTLATAGNEALGVTTVELDAGGVSYTINSLRALKDEYGGEAEIFFLLGADMFVNLEKWYLAKELLSEFSFGVGYRPGQANETVLADMRDRLTETYGAKISLIKNRQIDISSSEIRRRVREGVSIRYLVPDAVCAYIHEAGLYV